MANYIKRRGARKAWYFQKAVPVHLQGRAGKTWELCLGRDYATAVEASGRALKVVQGLTELMEITPPNPDPIYERKRWKLSNHLTEILNIKPCISRACPTPTSQLPAPSSQIPAPSSQLPDPRSYTPALTGSGEESGRVLGPPKGGPFES